MSRYDFFATAEERDLISLDKALKDRELDLYNYMLLLHALDCRNDSSLARVAHKIAVHQKDRTKFLSRFSRNMVTDPGAALDLMGKLGLLGIGNEGLEHLPSCAVVLEFEFVLEKNFLSRDDAPFYPIDNSVRKERIFRAPMISGSSWKGSLRAAAVDLLVLQELDLDRKMQERLALIEIFGDEKGEAEEGEEAGEQSLKAYLDNYLGEGKMKFEEEKKKRLGGASPEEADICRKGRVRCLPSYFNGIDLDVINPRSRKTRTGTVPIPMEMVPAGCAAKLGMIYLPFDLLGQEEAKIREQLRRDWNILGKALFRMFRESGFGAKKTSGCGKAQMQISGFRFECGMAGFKPPEVARLEGLTALRNCFEVVL